ncbi:MAG: hypothetical protein ACRDP7_01755 [Trebonia sp.]
MIRPKVKVRARPPDRAVRFRRLPAAAWQRPALRGRARPELVIRPLSYRDAASFWGITDPRLAVLVHSIVGGTPAYNREFVAGDVPSGLETSIPGYCAPRRIPRYGWMANAPS